MGSRRDPSVRQRACRLVGRCEHARLSGVADELLVRRVDVGRRKEPPRDESGFRAHGSNQRFHRLLRHAVARALTTAPSLAGVSPAAQFILIPQGWRRNEPPGTLSHKPIRKPVRQSVVGQRWSDRLGMSFTVGGRRPTDRNLPPPSHRCQCNLIAPIYATASPGGPPPPLRNENP